MFSQEELNFLHKLVEPVDINEVFDSEEIDAFQNNKGNICENLFIPRHRRKVQILRLKKIFTDNFDLYTTTESILNNLKNTIHLFSQGIN